jgi:hypothetical protein
MNETLKTSPPPIERLTSLLSQLPVLISTRVEVERQAAAACNQSRQQADKSRHCVFGEADENHNDVCQQADAHFQTTTRQAQSQYEATVNNAKSERNRLTTDVQKQCESTENIAASDRDRLAREAQQLYEAMVTSAEAERCRLTRDAEQQHAATVNSAELELDRLVRDTQKQIHRIGYLRKETESFLITVRRQHFLASTSYQKARIANEVDSSQLEVSITNIAQVVEQIEGLGYWHIYHKKDGWVHLWWACNVCVLVVLVTSFVIFRASWEKLVEYAGGGLVLSLTLSVCLKSLPICV